MTKLTRFSLKLSGGNIYDDDFEEMINDLKECTKLTHLKLEFSHGNYYLGAHVLKCLFNEISKIESLEKLSLEFAYVKEALTNDALSSISEGL